MGAASLDIVAEHAIGATLSTFEAVYERLLGRDRLLLRRAA
jgi:hypothetical protein